MRRAHYVKSSLEKISKVSPSAALETPISNRVFFSFLRSNATVELGSLSTARRTDRPGDPHLFRPRPRSRIRLHTAVTISLIREGTRTDRQTVTTKEVILEKRERLTSDSPLL